MSPGARWNRILCRLGRHDWEHVGPWSDPPVRWDYLQCNRCSHRYPEDH